MMQLPNLSHVGGDLNVMGNGEVSELGFPNLEVIKGDFILANSGFTRLPPKLNHVGGRVILSKSSPKSLLADVMRLAAQGMIQGGVYYCD
jgi:hypothetical protein